LYCRSLSLFLLLTSFAVAQNIAPSKQPASAPTAKKTPALVPSKSAAVAKPSSNKPDPRRQFVLDVARSAIALPQTDPQDRLRVISSALRVLAPFDAKQAQALTREGVRVEGDVIRAGEKPAASIFSSGRVDCTSTTDFVQNLPIAAVPLGEAALIRASQCAKQGLPAAQQKLEEALKKSVVAPRALMATMSAAGLKSQWSTEQFSAVFDALPKDYEKQIAEAPNFATLYAQMSANVDVDVAKKAGLKLLDWIGHLPESGERNLALNVTVGAMQHALGQEKYQDAIRGDIVVAGIVRQAGRPGQQRRPEEENASVLAAMKDNGQDMTSALRGLPPVRRAREAAAHGFSSGTSGDHKMADRYFEIAYAAVNEVWTQRSPANNAPAVVEEVNEAAAQVDPVAALHRAQRLEDPSAQAIGMLAVARVVAAQQSN